MNNSHLISRKAMNVTSSWLYNIFRYALLIGVSYVVLFPIIKMVSAAFTLPEELYMEEAGFLPSAPTFVNFTRSQAYFNYLKFLKPTLKIAITCTIFMLISCSLVGYGLARFKFKGNALVYAAVLFTIILPTQISLIPQYYEYSFFDIFGIGRIIGLFTGKAFTINLIPKFGAIYVPALFGVGLNAGIYIFLFRQFFAGMPKDLEEAGKLDGCNPFQIYLRIMLPNIKPVVVTVALLSVIYYWNDTLIISALTDYQDGRTLMTALEEFTRSGVFWGWDMHDIMTKLAESYAIVLSVVAPLIILFLVGQKFFVECMDRSGSKG